MSLREVIVSALALVAVAFAVLFGHPGAPQPITGSVTGPDSYYTCENHNGVTSCNTRQAIRSATTTVCAIKSPTATSSLQFAGVRVNTASSTATIWDLARAANAFATTTAIGTAYNIAGCATADIQASTSPAAGAATVFPPSTYLVVGARQSITAGDTAGTGSNTAGYCDASFTVL
jgi:hypothetical protein